MMKLKLLIFSCVFVFSFLLASCVEEPFIAPVKTPYSIIRVGNFTNQSSFKLSIDDKFIESLGQNGITNYFRVTSGNRHFVITNDNGDTLYSRPISIISYEQETILFSGYFDQNVNNIKFKLYRDSKVYIPDNTPPLDTSFVRFVNLLTLSPNDSLDEDIKFYLSAKDTNNVYVPFDSTSTLKQFDKELHIVAKGSYLLSAVSLTDTNEVIVDIGSKKNYYIISNGGPANFDFTVDSQDPLPPQSK